KFPVAAIGRVIGVIVVPVMNRQLTKIGACEFAAAATAHPRIDLEGLLSVALFALFSSVAGLGHYAVQFVLVCRFHAVILLKSNAHLRAGVSTAVRAAASTLVRGFKGAICLGSEVEVALGQSANFV